MIRALTGWQRIGVILSALWFVGFGVFLFEHEMSERNSFLDWQLGNCLKIAEMRREPLQPDDPVHAQIMRDLRNCTDRASDFFTEQVGKLWSNIWVLLLVDVATIVLAWLLAWIVVRLVRWVLRGFHKSAAQ